MAEENTESTETETTDPAAEVVADSLAAMREDARAAILSEAIEKAWDGARFDVDVAIAAIVHPDTR